MSLISIFRFGLFIIAAALLAPYLGIHILTSPPDPLQESSQSEPLESHHLIEHSRRNAATDLGGFAQKSHSDEDSSPRPGDLNDIERLLNQ